MEVSHNDNPDTHTVIGGNAVKSASIALTSEFISVLSDNIYTDKPLAVVREIICNAWDSHIASGITNVNIKVTLTEDKFIVRDFGKGIPDNKMEEVYYTYGQGTKTKKEKETGGFGLGSKAPYAYTDHFTVTSYNNGKQNTYAMSKGSSETNGLPDFRTIVSVPTSQTGLEVTVPLREGDKHKFSEIIEMITAYGDMGVELNGKVLKRYPFSKAEDGFLVIPKHHYQKAINNYYIRYGTVIYPIPNDDFYQKELNKIIFNNKRKSYNNTNFILVFNAPNNSISVNPSRETLSLSNKTLSTIKNLLIEFNNKVQKTNIEVLDASIEKIVQISAEENDSISLYKTLVYKNLKVLKIYDLKHKIKKPECIDNIFEFCYYQLTNDDNKYLSNISFLDFKNILIKYTLKYNPKEYKNVKLLCSLKKGKFYTFQNKYLFIRNYNKITSYYLKNLLGEYSKYLKFVYVNEHKDTKAQISNLDNLSFFKDTMLSNKNVVIGYNIKSICDGLDKSYYCLNITRKKGVYEEIKKILKDNNINIIDRCKTVSPKLKPIINLPKKPHKKGYTSLAYFLKHNSYDNLNILSDHKRETISKPSIVFNTQTSNGRKVVENYNTSNAKIISRLFPNAIIVSSYETAKNVEKKFNLESSSTILNNLILSYENDPEFISQCSFLDGYQYHNYMINYLIKIAEFDKEIKKLLGISSKKQQEKYKDLVDLFSIIRGKKGWYNSSIVKDEFKSLDEKIKKTTSLNKSLKTLIEEDSVLFAFKLDVILKNLRKKSPQSKAMLNTLKVAIIK